MEANRYTLRAHRPWSCEARHRIDKTGDDAGADSACTAYPWYDRLPPFKTASGYGNGMEAEAWNLATVKAWGYDCQTMGWISTLFRTIWKETVRICSFWFMGKVLWEFQDALWLNTEKIMINRKISWLKYLDFGGSSRELGGISCHLGIEWITDLQYTEIQVSMKSYACNQPIVPIDFDDTPALLLKS